MCVCACVRERERVCVCVWVCVRKKKKNWSNISSCHASKVHALLTITAVTNLAWSLKPQPWQSLQCKCSKDNWVLFLFTPLFPWHFSFYFCKHPKMVYLVYPSFDSQGDVIWRCSTGLMLRLERSQCKVMTCWLFVNKSLCIRQLEWKCKKCIYIHFNMFSERQQNEKCMDFNFELMYFLSVSRVIEQSFKEGFAILFVSCTHTGMRGRRYTHSCWVFAAIIIFLTYADILPMLWQCVKKCTLEGSEGDDSVLAEMSHTLLVSWHSRLFPHSQWSFSLITRYWGLGLLSMSKQHNSRYRYVLFVFHFLSVCWKCLCHVSRCLWDGDRP